MTLHSRARLAAGRKKSIGKHRNTKPNHVSNTPKSNVNRDAVDVDASGVVVESSSNVANNNPSPSGHSTNSPFSPPSSSSSKPCPVFGYWENKQLTLSTTLQGFLTSAPHDEYGNYHVLTIPPQSAQGDIYTMGAHISCRARAVVAYTQLELQNLWDSQADRPGPIIVIGVRGQHELHAFQQFTLEEIWSLAQRNRLGRAEISWPVRQPKPSDMVLRQMHERDSKVVNLDQMINTTNMKECYHLSEQYVKTFLSPWPGTCRAFQDGHWVNANCKLYWERDIEFLAWKLYGPTAEKFVRFLFKEYQRRSTTIRKRHLSLKAKPPPKPPFKVPCSYALLFKVVWDTKYPGSTLDSNILFVNPPSSAVLRDTSDSGTNAAPMPLPPPSRRPRFSEAAEA